MPFSEEQFRRYARHIILPEIGGKGQARLLQAKVLVVGAGGLGSPLLMYLAAAGVGTIGVVDDDVVELSNLQRQIIHPTHRLGVAKVESAAAAIASINTDCSVITHRLRLGEENVQDLVAGYDVVADGSDNFPTRYLLNDTCYFAGVPLVSAAILRFDAQISTYKAYLEGDHPCYRCLFPEPPPAGTVPSCAEGGVLGALAGTIGALQASETIKEILGIGKSLSGHLLLFDALESLFRKIRVSRDPDCALCSTPRPERLARR